MEFLRKYAELLDQGYSEESAAFLADEESYDYYNGESYDEWN